MDKQTWNFCIFTIQHKITKDIFKLVLNYKCKFMKKMSETHLLSFHVEIVLINVSIKKLLLRKLLIYAKIMFVIKSTKFTE